ncbi:dCTP deaminase [Halalkalibacter krulwichiae]|uniref:Deoxycytidine triphosphate deaminase n=1 Tax=Halalkalibacter krulwichiae TaxID=199441 RepID=A0A1X9M8I5_9BACI|nr:dCTP deaminase [Halalkalibacter krulwichiae]ARK29707.1 Deoxycytidine triphosphate deaminase [Halalkalibacter krulwichiae]
MLSDRELHKLAIEEELIAPYNPEYCEEATINLTLDPLVKQYSSDEPIVLGKEVNDDEHYDKIDLTSDEFSIPPKGSVLIQTHEFIKVPNNMTARIYERFGVQSLGLMISPGHYMNPGYRGKISLVAFNTNSVPFRLVPGIKICQMGLFELNTDPLKPYEKQDARYMDSTDVSISKLHLDQEIQEFLKEKGIAKVSDEMAGDLGKHLMSHIKLAAKDLAELAMEKLDKGKI